MLTDSLVGLVEVVELVFISLFTESTENNYIQVIECESLTESMQVNFRFSFRRFLSWFVWDHKHIWDELMGQPFLSIASSCSSLWHALRHGLWHDWILEFFFHFQFDVDGVITESLRHSAWHNSIFLSFCWKPLILWLLFGKRLEAHGSLLLGR